MKNGTAGQFGPGRLDESFLARTPDPWVLETSDPAFDLLIEDGQVYVENLAGEAAFTIRDRAGKEVGRRTPR